MKHPIVIILFLLLIPALSLAGDMEDDPVLASLIVDKREMRTADGSNPVEWDVEAWAGKDLNKIWLKTKGEYRKKKLRKPNSKGYTIEPLALIGMFRLAFGKTPARTPESRIATGPC